MDNRILQMVLSIAFIALMAQLTIHLPSNLGGIPITGQSLAVLVVACWLPWHWGLLSVVLYVVLGGLGLPIFADGETGWAVIVGGSGGFLFGFIAAAAVIGYLSEKGWTKHFGKLIIAMLIGTIVILFWGILRLSMLYGFEKAMGYGFYPFWKGALVKVLLGALIVFYTRRVSALLDRTKS
jgi:biotin transport system substrate-specific component